MYAFFPLLLMAIAAAMLGAWLIHDARFRRQPLLAAPGWLLVAVLPLALAGFLAAGLAGPRAGGRWLISVLLITAGALLLLAAVAAVAVMARIKRGAPSRPGLLGPTLLVPALAAISACFLLSLLLSLSDGTLNFR
jgi:hypothetical protein